MGLAEQDLLAGVVYIARDVSYTHSGNPGDFAAGQARGGGPWACSSRTRSLPGRLPRSTRP
ncbi:hypothetical protein CBM2637_A170016 [Cupriavidus taiwanensis]|nr:hypothetical protein CBM2637_A170016 [Cupriavidus taiwanensis]